MSFLIVIPANFTSDLHICGKCKAQFTILEDFFRHKLLQSCISDAAKDPPDKNFPVAGTIPLYDGRVSENSVIVSNDNFKSLNDNFEAASLEIRLDDQFLSRSKLLTEEEDVVDLLANQFSKQDCKASTDGPNLDIVVDVLPENSSNKIIESVDSHVDDKNICGQRVKNVFRCSFEGCTYQTSMKKDSNRHARTHTGERPFNCSICGKSYQRSDKLLVHKRGHAGEKPHKCTLCPYAAVDSGSLVKHLRVHNGERPLRCMLCPYRCREPSQLTVHIRSHTGDSPFLCTHDQCRSAFKTKSDLKRHMAIHSGVKLGCVLCHYKTSFKGNLLIHMEKHHPDGKLADYRCKHCSETFLTLRKLNGHAQKMHSELPNKGDFPSNKMPKFEKKRKKQKGDLVGTLAKAFSCDQCSASFVCSSSLQAHERFHEKLRIESQIANSHGIDERLHGSDEGKRGIGRMKEDAGMITNSLGDKSDNCDGLLDNEGSFTVLDNMRAPEMLSTFPPPMQSSRAFLLW